MAILKVIHNEQTIEVNIDKNTYVSEALLTSSINIDRPCAGQGICGKCKVKFIENPPEANEFDKRLLTANELMDGYRLSCKAIITSDSTIKITDKYSEQKILTAGETSTFNVQLDNISSPNNYGIAVDIGTTTIVVYLVNILNGNIIATESSINPQRSYGDNVISRCEYIHSNSDGLEILQNAVINEINKLTLLASKKAQINTSQIIRAVFSGNTIMEHIFLGVDPYNISVAPFTPEFIEQKHALANEINLNISKNADVYITNSIAGYVGGDIVAGMVSANMMESEKINLLIDIGTNGEIILGNKYTMMGCSVAAGPAFEGAHIKHGIGGVNGAINKASIEGNTMNYNTINNMKAIGICGSGLLDIVSNLKNLGVMDETGALNESYLTLIDDEMVYPITDDIYLTQKDIREVQLAKSAISAGIDTLIKYMKISYDDIDNVYVSGGFGSYMNIVSGANIGLIPKELEKKCITIGNSAGTGSIKMLLSDKELSKAKIITNHVQYVELSMDMTFNNLFIENMTF